MKKSEQIKKQIKDHESELAKIQLKIRGLKVELIAALNSESDFEIGEKVAVLKQTYNNAQIYIGEGFFTGYIFSSFGGPYPRILNVKKDGTASKNEWSKYDFSTIQKIDK